MPDQFSNFCNYFSLHMLYYSEYAFYAFHIALKRQLLTNAKLPIIFIFTIIYFHQKIMLMDFIRCLR